MSTIERAGHAAFVAWHEVMGMSYPPWESLGDIAKLAWGKAAMEAAVSVARDQNPHVPEVSVVDVERSSEMSESNAESNTERREGFAQVCVWEGTVVGADKVKEFEAFVLDEMGGRIQYLEEITTGPGMGGEGGRIDVLFAVHEDDVPRFAVSRLAYGVRWIEDAIDGGSSALYPGRVREYENRDDTPDDTPDDDDDDDCDFDDDPGYY